MERKNHSFPVTDFQLFKLKLLLWCEKYDLVSFLDNNQYTSRYSTYECLAAVGCRKRFDITKDLFASMSSFVNETNDWIFGHLNYDIKNYVEDLFSDNIDNIKFPDAFLFVPETVFILEKDKVTIGITKDDAKSIFAAICNQQIPAINHSHIDIIPRTIKHEYIENIKKLKLHILRGECYEINYCQEFFAENTTAFPISIYRLLTEISPNPFCSFYKIDDKFLMCSSPERFFAKRSPGYYFTANKRHRKKRLN